MRVSHANGVRFDIKVEKAALCPKNTQKRKPRPGIRPRKLEWTCVDETDDAKISELYKQSLLQTHVANTTGLPDGVSGLIAEFVGDDWRMPAKAEADARTKLLEVIVRRGRALTTGYGGTGKTEFMKALLKLWKKREPKVNFVLAAFPHTAARLMGAGNTLAHVLNSHRYGPPANTVYVIDEISQVPMSMLSVIARGVHLGARFVMLGDFEGQFLPIADGWSSSRPVRDTELVKDLAGCLHVRLTTNWRCRDDPAHFERYVGLYPYADASPDVVRAKVREVQRHYRWNKQRQVDIYLVISHRKRRAVNRKLNLERDAMDGVYIPSVGGVNGLSSQPQAMWLRPGMSVLGCSGTRKKVINGCEYIVAAVTADTVTVDMHADYHTGNDKMERGVVLTHPEASKWLRLAYARCYYPTQGRTLRDAVVMLLDTGHRHFGMRHLIVGLSRVPKSSDLIIPSAAQELEFAAELPDVPDEPVNSEETEEQDTPTDSDSEYED